MRIYSAPVLAQVMHIKHVLEMHDIACHIQGEYRSGAAGELPLTETWPELWVVDPSNVEEAKRLVAEALAPAGPGAARLDVPELPGSQRGPVRPVLELRGERSRGARTPESRLFADIDQRALSD